MGINPLECNLIGDDAFRGMFALLITLVRQESTNPCGPKLVRCAKVNLKFHLDKFETPPQNYLYVYTSTRLI